MERLFIDTSAWFSYADLGDPDHVRIVKAFKPYKGRLVTSNYVLDETITLCRHRLGHRAAVLLGETILDPDLADLIRIEARDERAAWDLFASRSDKDYSFTDCTSLVVMRELGLRRVLTTDRHFAQMGFEVLPGGVPGRRR